MIWLDGVFAVPVIGIRLEPHFKELLAFENGFLSFINHLHEDKKLDLEITKTKEIWGYSVSLKKKGFNFKIYPTNIVIGFAYEIEEERRPGKFPHYIIPNLTTYSELLKGISEYTEAILHNLKDVRGFKYNRIGIVADASLNKESFPPGLNNWIDYLGKPWKGQTRKIEAVLLAKLDETQVYYDQCHHHIKFNEESPESGFEFKLDWQRLFKEPLRFDTKNMLETVAQCQEEAIKYFEKFGEGDLDYE